MPPEMRDMPPEMRDAVSDMTNGMVNVFVQAIGMTDQSINAMAYND